MKTFNQETKNKYVARVKAHAEADEIVKGKYWENGKGCAVGCTIEGSDHSRYETELGIPRAIARLEDRIFEGLPNEVAMKFPLSFIEAVPFDTDLSMVVPKFFVWLLGDEKDGVIKYVGKYKKCKAAVETVLDLYKKTVGGEVIKEETWRDAATAADAAAATADAAYAAYAATAAADATAAATDAARSTARQNHYVKMADKLIELIKEAK